MTTKLTTFIAFFACAAIFAQTTSIPDLNFETKLVNLGIDSNGINGNILNSDALPITFLDVSNATTSRLEGNEVISSLVGIEAFLNLESLNCSNNNLTTLPIGSNTDLTFLDFSNNQISNISLNQNPFLLTLEAGFNQLGSLNLSNNPFLEVINCESNLLSGLNVTNKNNLVDLNCQSNIITAISSIPAMLQTFNASNNILSSVNFTNISSLVEFKIANNNFTSLDLTVATSLTELDVENNDLTTLDLRNGTNTGITLMNATNNTGLGLICVDDATFSETAPGWTKDGTSAYSESCTLSIENPSLLDFKIINPIAQSIKIPQELLKDTKSLKIYTSNGQQVYSGLVSNINTSSYTKGFYFLSIETHSGKRNMYKLVKN